MKYDMEITCALCARNRTVQLTDEFTDVSRWLRTRPACRDGVIYTICIDCSDNGVSGLPFVQVKEVPSKYKIFMSVGDKGYVIMTLTTDGRESYVVETTKRINNIDVVQWSAELHIENIEWL
jgi:hypothetical protein